MDALRSEIRALTRPSLFGAPTSAQKPAFVTEIVQIKFNAWHFADANLWASLTAVFFDRLRRGGSESSRQHDYQELIGKVAEKVRSLEANATQAVGKVEDAKRKLETATNDLATAEKQLAASELALAWDEVQADFESIRKDNQGKLKDIGRRVYRDDLSADSKSFATAVAEAASTPGRLALIGRILVSGGTATWLGLVAIVAIGGIAIALPSIETTNAATLYQRIAAWGAGTFAALGALWKALHTAKPILDGAWKYAKAVEGAREKVAEDLDAKRKEAAAAATALQAAEAQLAGARAPLGNLLQGRPADAPATILRYFLFEDGDVRDYDKQVGIVSRARRSFEQLNAIVGTARLGRKADEKFRRGETLTKDEEALRTKWLDGGDGKGLRVPDRIVLYIDDLDRCTHEQVYAVLQAIHLLLSFELFVVVVGVDVRWIEAAIAKNFEKYNSSSDGAERGPSIQQRKQALDYLEKIFQIAFWLERLSVGSGTSQGSYGAYVRMLLKDNERETPGPNIFKSTVPETVRFDAGRAADDLDTEAAASPDEATSSSEDASGEDDEFAAVDAALASLKLDKAEVEYLASPVIGALASKSPRAVKRLVNVYRIVRARLSEGELKEFLGDADKSPRYPVATLLCALETGQPLELIELFYPALEAMPANVPLALIMVRGDPSDEPTRQGRDLMMQAIALAPALAAAIHDVGEKCGTPGGSVGEYLKLAKLVRRYSFNRYC